MGFAMHVPRIRRGAQRKERCDGNPDSDGHDRVDRHRDQSGEHEHDRVGPRRPDDASHGRQRHHARRGDHEHSGQRSERDLRHDTGREGDCGEQHEGVDDRSEPGAPARAHVHRGAGDRSGGGHASEEAGGDRGETLPDQLAVGVVRSGIGERRGIEARQGRCGEGARQGPNTGKRQPGDGGDHRDHGDRDGRSRQLRMDAGHEHHDRRHQRDGSDRRDNSGDDGGHEPALGSRTGTHPEGQSKRERDDAHGDSRNKVAGQVRLTAR
jgi:hypothetical protein